MRKVEILPQTDFCGFEISSKKRDSRPLKEYKISINCTCYNLVESLVSINFIFNISTKQKFKEIFQIEKAAKIFSVQLMKRCGNS